MTVTHRGGLAVPVSPPRPFRHASGEIGGECAPCIEEMSMGYDLPVCSSADPADDDAELCAWCGHTIEARP